MALSHAPTMVTFLFHVSDIDIETVFYMVHVKFICFTSHLVVFSLGSWEDQGVFRHCDF